MIRMVQATRFKLLSFDLILQNIFQILDYRLQEDISVSHDVETENFQDIFGETGDQGMFIEKIYLKSFPIPLQLILRTICY